MTSPPENPFFGNLPPPPVFEITMEQEFNLRRITDLLEKADKADIITLFLALQKQNYCMANTIRNLLKQWPTTTDEEVSKSGILFVIKDFLST